MVIIKLERGKRFKDCPLEIFRFVYSDWSVADKVTGNDWKVIKLGKNIFKGGLKGFWAEFNLREHKIDDKSGVFQYYTTFGGNLLNGSGMLIITYYAVDENDVYGAGKIDLELRGFLSSILVKIFKSRIYELTDYLTDYQEKACSIIARNPQAIMELLSIEQQNELHYHLKEMNKRDIFESKLEIIPYNGKCSLKFEAPIPIFKKFSKNVEVKETYKDFINTFNHLIECGNNYYNLSRYPLNPKKV